MPTACSARRRRSGYHLLRTAVALAASLLATAVPGADAISDVDVVVLQSSSPHAAYLVTPLLAHMAGENGEMPLLLVRESESDSQTLLVLKQLAATNILHLGVSSAYPPGTPVRQALPELQAGQTFQQAVTVARYGWRQPTEAVLAYAEDHANLAQAAILAAHLRVPLLPYNLQVTSAAALSAFERLGIRRLLLVAPDPRRRPAWYPRVQGITKSLTTAEAEQRVITCLGAANIRNVVLIGPPSSAENRTHELAPYYSVTRGSAPAVTKSSAADDGEAAVRGVIKRHGLCPRTLTLLGSVEQLQGHTIEFTGTLPDDLDATAYTLEAEPGSVPASGRAIAFGVGRLPFESIERTSHMLARTFHRERHLEEFSRSTVMIANPNRISALPLAETVARVTAQEFKNTRVPIQEFYRIAAEEAEVRAVAHAANVILFQGHSHDQHVLESSSPFDDLPEGDLPEPGPDGSVPSPFRMRIYTVDEVGEPSPPRMTLDGDGVPVSADETAPLPQQELNGLPFVLLQSCSSMSDYYTDPYFDAGAVAVIGSVTPIHSGSGSSFAKAFCNALLYQTNRTGEALRFAKNYFLCLQQLKAGRHHQNLHPGWRVGHSFRLYGDPELALFPAELLKRKKRLLRATWTDDGIRVHVPDKRFKDVKTAKYTAGLLPGNMAAGIVQGVAGTERRELMPFEFFTLPYTNGVPGDFSQPFRRVGDKTFRTTHLTDDFGHLYILHFPRSEPEGKFFKLRLGGERQ